MILAQWSCEVPLENKKRLINFAKEKLKPFYESYGCKRYEIFFPITPTKNYFSYQTSDKKNRYTEQLIFTNIKDFEKFNEMIEQDKDAHDLVGKYVKEFGISECHFKIFKIEL